MKKDELGYLLQDIYEEICRKPADLARIKALLEKLLLFLSSSEGYTVENCGFVDNYFCLKDNWPRCIEHLPEELYNILFDIGGTLHDAVKNREIASNFESLPEQLLYRLRGIKV